MRDSVLTQDMEHCIICGRNPVHRHHIFYGSANRKLSDEDGYWVPLCMGHHETYPEAVHRNHFFDLILKETAQRHYEQTHTREQFIARYGKSYL